MNTRTNYEQLAAKVDYAGLEKKLTQLAQACPPKRRKTVSDVLEPVREHLLTLSRNGWTSVQMVAELKAAGVPISPARLRECLNRWMTGGDRASKSRPQRRSKQSSDDKRAIMTASQHGRNKSAQDDAQPGFRLTER
jgi:hypothetical protein